MKFVVNSEVEILCPECGGKMLVKENRHTGHQFLGCPRWPDCNHTEKIPESMIMKATGQKELL